MNRVCTIEKSSCSTEQYYINNRRIQPDMLATTASTLLGVIYDHYLTLIIVSVVTYILYFLHRPRNLPPGPYGYPVIGSYLDMSIDLSTGFTKLGEKYGDIVTLWMGGNRYWVVLNSYDAIKEVYITRGADFSDREPTYNDEDTIFNAHYDDVYKESRKITAQFVRTFVREKLDSTLQSQMGQVHGYISDHGLLDRPMNLQTYLSRVLGNVIFTVVFGKTFKHGDAEADLLFTKLRQWFLAGFEIEALEYSPLSRSALRHKIEQFDGLQEYLETLVGKYVDDHVSTFQEDSIRDIVDAYLKVDGLNRFGRRKMINTFLTLLPDSAATSVFTGLFLFIYLLNFPKYQDAIAEEVNQVTGRKCRISIDDRSNMPVTESFIMEVFRRANPATVGIQTKPLKDTKLRGYNIPKYVDIIPNYQGVHHDPVLFPNPDTFKPARFITDGKVQNLEGFIPFGLGRRMCVGEHLVRNNLFIVLTSMIQRYRIKPGPTGMPGLHKDQSSVVGRPQKFTVILQERQ